LGRREDDLKGIILSVWQFARQRVRTALGDVLLHAHSLGVDPEAFALLGGEVLDRRMKTFLKSAICSAYCEGVLLRLGASASSQIDGKATTHSSLINLFISNNRKETTSLVELADGLLIFYHAHDSSRESYIKAIMFGTITEGNTLLIGANNYL
jgi:hypothetical protein